MDQNGQVIVPPGYLAIIVPLPSNAFLQFSRKMEGALAKEIRDSVIRRCQPCGNIVHVYIDKRSAHVSNGMMGEGEGATIGDYRGVLFQNLN